MTWHADTDILHRYARGELGDVAAASVEAHVTDCPTCRQLAVSCADAGALTRIKVGLDERLDAPPMTRMQRALQRVGIDERDARLVTGALSLEMSWCAASLLVICFALMAATLGTNRPTVGLFVALAPLVPLAGVALAYAPRVDPTFEVAQASPMSAVRLLLVRSGTVVALTVPVLIVLSAPFGQLLAFGWLLPALALIGVALALGTFWPLQVVAAALAGLWVAGATFAISEAPALTADAFARHFVVVQWPGQLICAAVGAGSIAVFATRRHTYEVPPMTSNHDGVELSGLTRRYGRTLALDHVALSAGPGVTGLLGPNGAGKTTLLRIVATVLRADIGDISILGRRTPWGAQDHHAIRSRLGYQPQEPGFFQGFTVRDFIDYVAVLKEIDDRHIRRREVARVIELVGLEREAGRKIRRLSAGTRRRVAIAQALLGRPRLLIFDEPTAGLDPEQRMRFREVVSTVAAEATVLLSTHQTDDVTALCDRVAVMHEGQVRFAGTPVQLADLAAGHVWLAEGPGTGAWASWRTGTGEHRMLGVAPAGARSVAPTVEDGYMVLVERNRHRLEARP